MALFKTDTSRRREVRRNIPRHRPALREVMGRSQVFWGVVIGVVFIVGAAWLVNTARFSTPYTPGELIDQPIVARVNFNSLDLAAVSQAREDARRKTPAVYRPNKVFFEETEKVLLSLPEAIAKAETIDDVESKLVERFGLTNDMLEALRLYVDDGTTTPRWRSMIDALMRKLKRTAILRDEDYQIEKVNLAPTIRLVYGEDERSLLVWEGELIKLSDPKEVKSTTESLASEFPEPLRKLVVGYMLKSNQPTYTLHPQRTEQARDDAAANINEDDFRVDYQAGQVLIRAGQVLDAAGHRLLTQHMDAIPPKQRLAIQAGLTAMVGFICLILIGYVVAFKRRIIEKPVRGIALATLMLACLAFAWLGLSLPPQVTTTAPIVPILLISIIVAVAYDQRFAMGMATFGGLLMGLALDLSIGNYLLMMIAAIVAIAQLKQLRNRSTLGRVGLVTGLVVAAGVWAVGLSERHLVEGLAYELGRESLVGFSASVLVGFVILGVLPFIEKMFKVTTAMTLLELGDMNHPLLKRLAQQAPGTFNHSLQVATLAEAASDAIGANGLLARVGAYYHDIGKIHKPQYFVENQAGGPSRHDKLSPAMSLLIIVGHVKDGVEMAREYGLPPVLHHFIESHHGTTLVEYFYHAAKKQKGGDQQPEEVEFRYPGPKPRTKEAAILMLCDCVESACRTMAEPTAVRIEQLVEKLANKRLMDGQFNHCDITLGELRLVEQAVTKSLCAIYHGRISYPAGESDKQSAKSDKGRAAG